MTTATTRLDPIAYYAWGLGILCAATLILIVGFAIAARHPHVTVVEPEPVDEGPAHHASDQMAANHTHRPRHGEGVRQVDPEVYNGRAWHLDEATGPIDITGEFLLTGQVEIPVLGQDPRIAEPIAPCVDDLFTTDWFSDDRMAGRR